MYSVKLYSDHQPSEQPAVARAFLEATRIFRATDAFRSNIFYSIAHQIATSSVPKRPEKVFFWVVSASDAHSTSSPAPSSISTTTDSSDDGVTMQIYNSNDTVVGIAMCTDINWGLVLSPMPAGALTALFYNPEAAKEEDRDDSIFSSFYDKYGKNFPCVVVPNGLEDEFLKIYSSSRPSQWVTEGLKEIIYKLDNEKLTIPYSSNSSSNSGIATESPIPGRMRCLTPTEADTDLAVQMYENFVKELGINQPDIKERVDMGLKDGRFFVWMVNIQKNQNQLEEYVVAFAGHVPVVGIGQPGEIGVGRVAPVFTPVIHRRKGYAAALTAALSRHMIDHLGARVMLYAEASNVASNRAYTKIGFEAVGRNTKFKII